MNRHSSDSGFRALYIRVSTEAQAEEGFSIQAQSERLAAYCKAMGWDHCQAYIDGGFTGSNLNRPEMQRLIADVEAGKIRSVIVYKLDRLSRSQKDTLFLIEDVFMPKNVDFISLNESIDTSTPYGRAMIGILSAFAQLERENIFIRTRMGMLERVKQGYWPGGGCTPFGYDYDREQGTLIPNTDAVIVRKMYDLYIQGYSAQRIADMLGLRYDRLVTQILSRKSNLGVISYKGEEYKGRHAPIVSQEVFELAMQKMKERSQKARATTKRHHLLTGLVYCGACGAKMRYMQWGQAGYKLRCYSQDPSKPYMHKDACCSAQAVWADQIESVVLSDLFKLSASLDGKPSDGERMLIDPLRELKTRIMQTETKLKRLYHLYAEAADDMLLSAIEENKDTLAMLKREYGAEEKTQVAGKRLQDIRLQVASLAQSWPHLGGMERQAIIRDCVNKIIITGDRVEIFYTFAISKTQTQVA